MILILVLLEIGGVVVDNQVVRVGMATLESKNQNESVRLYCQGPGVHMSSDCDSGRWSCH